MGCRLFLVSTSTLQGCFFTHTSGTGRRDAFLAPVLVCPVTDDSQERMSTSVLALSFNRCSRPRAYDKGLKIVDGSTIIRVQGSVLIAVWLARRRSIRKSELLCSSNVAWTQYLERCGGAKRHSTMPMHGLCL